MSIIDDNQEIIDRFKALPENEKTVVEKKAFELVEETVKAFVEVLDKAPVSEEAKLTVLENVWGFRRGQTEEEAMIDESDFSKKYNVAVIAAVITLMKEKEELERKINERRKES